MRVLITGGCGFIGSAVVRHGIRLAGATILNIDKLTYASMPQALEDVEASGRYHLRRNDICDPKALETAFSDFAPDAVMHLAAESHVDRSIDSPSAFIQTNILGTYTVLEAARSYWTKLSPAAKRRFRFHHVSTDEVYGSLDIEAPMSAEDAPYRPRSPYSASKASADHLVRAWSETFGLPVLVTNCSNNYGPWQFPEKLIPVMITKAQRQEQLPIYGKGLNVRDWLHVEDHARALWDVLAKGRVGETYNIGGGAERRNIDVVETICRLMDERFPQRGPHDRLIHFVQDRPGHDLRYAIDAGKLQAELGWEPSVNFESGLGATVDWYLRNEAWWQNIETSKGERQGLALEPERAAD